MLKKILYLPRIPFLWIIKIYQKIISPDHGILKIFFPHGYCKYYPSCSQYGHEVIQKRGLIIGLPRAVWRILRCNPWSGGGIDRP